MVLFDLNDGRSATATGVSPSAYDRGHFAGTMPAVVKSVKRLYAHPWPFAVKGGTAQHSAEFNDVPHRSSSFVS